MNPVVSQSTNTHCVTARLPASWADLAMFVSVLEGLHQAQCLIHRSAHRQVVHGDLAEDALGVNDEQASGGKACYKTVNMNQSMTKHNIFFLCLNLDVH